MLEIPHSLPPGALLDAEGRALEDLLSGQGAHWFRALPDFIATQPVEADTQETFVSGWTSAISEVSAAPTRPNDRAGRFDGSGAPPAMCFRAQHHCGYAVPAIAPSAERFSLAVIYASEERDARTLFSVTGADNSNILFGFEKTGTLAVKDRAGTVELAAEAPATGPEAGGRHGLLVVSHEMGKLRMAVNAGPTLEASGRVPGLTDTAELFIGCRSHRPGLAKTLGTARITDVIFWPDRMVLGPSGLPSDPSLGALRDFWKWNR
jgi:hypothetical protein